MTAAELSNKLEKIVNEMRKLQDKTITNNDWFTIQQCIDIVRKVEKEDSND